MVALVVLAVGVLGLLGLQLRTMADNQSSGHRMTAARFAEELFERIKANPDNIPNTEEPLANEQWSWLSRYALDWGDTPAISTNCASAFCTGTQRAEWDLAVWSQSIQQGGLPGGNAMVTVSPDNPRQMVVILGWRVNESKEATGNSSYTSPFAVSIPGITTPSACGTTHICYAAYGQP